MQNEMPTAFRLLMRSSHMWFFLIYALRCTPETHMSPRDDLTCSHGRVVLQFEVYLPLDPHRWCISEKTLSTTINI